MSGLIHLILLLLFLSILGLAVASSKTVKERFAFLPALGFGAVTALGYVISANLKISGALAMSYATLLLLSIILVRSRSLFESLRMALQEGVVKQALLICLIPLFTLLIPALWQGFDFFYANVNFDFFYNSQDSWYLKTHHVLEYNPIEGESPILPLSWSANFQGRFGVSLLAAFFSYWTQIDTVQFNSLLLNTLVVVFALCMSVFCKELFRLNRKSLFFAVFFSVMSAGFVQSYSYYLLGQLSAIPIFIVYCVVLKSLLDERTPNNVIALALLFNVLYILYAILGFFALFLTFICFCIKDYPRLRKHNVTTFIQVILLAGMVFWLIRVFAIRDSLQIINHWITISTKVASGNTVMIFSEYLKDSFLALFFGIVNYPSTTSIFRFVKLPMPVVNYLIAMAGLAACVIFLMALKAYAYSKENSNNARTVIIALAILVIACASYFFFSLAPYGIFKLQTWFIPLLMPLFVYAFYKKNHWAILCGVVLVFNLVTSMTYIADFFAPDQSKMFANIRGVTGNSDLQRLATKLKTDQAKGVSLFLTNGIESAWLANSMRSIPLIQASQIFQPAASKDLDSEPCASARTQNFSTDGWWVLANPDSIRSEITEAPLGGDILYKNDSYWVVNPAHVKLLVFLGKGAYPVELNVKNKAFPQKFRWVEKGVEVMVYSDQARLANLLVEVTPGYVETKNKVRQLAIKTDTNRYHFSFQSTQTMTVPNVPLRKGLNCFLLESEDEIIQPKSGRGMIRSNLPLDSRVISFAVSHVSVK